MALFDPCRRLAAILLCAATVTAIGAETEPPAPGMVRIPEGLYQPFFRSPTDPRTVPVAAFALDVVPVTNGDFLRFVRDQPQWRRSGVKRLFADESYLESWAGDLDPGGNAPLHAPVTSVSWFAARAYARWCGRRLPTLVEWEYAARVGEAGGGDPTTTLPTAGESGGATGLPDGETGPVGRSAPNRFGVRDLNRLVWEWVADFNTAMVTGDARGETGLDRQLFCGAGAQGARDPADFAAFMRFGFRSSLKADYCIHNLGFRCAKDL